MGYHNISHEEGKFHVVTMISNSARFDSRFRLYKEFEQRMTAAGVQLTTIELAQGNRKYEVTEEGNPRHIQIKYYDELWLKENALNIAVSRLPYDWKYVAWIDADVQFMHPDWVQQCIHQLQVYQVVQMWEHAVDLGPNWETLHTHKSFMSEYIKRGAVHPEANYSEFHPGFAWACRREAFDMMGGLLERAILGAADRHMALALVGKAQYSFHPKLNSKYQEYILEYQNRCETSIRRDVGFVPGTVLHTWHGKKADRKYYDRWQILVTNDYQPYHDLKKNSYGLFQLNDDGTERFVRLRDQLRGYFRVRNEDSIDLV